MGDVVEGGGKEEGDGWVMRASWNWGGEHSVE